MKPTNILRPAMALTAFAATLCALASAAADEASDKQAFANNYHAKLCSAATPEEALKAVYSWHGLRNDGEYWSKAFATKPLPPDLQLVALQRQITQEQHRLDIVKRAAEEAKKLKELLDANNKVLADQQKFFDTYKEMGVAVLTNAPEPYPECACSGGGSRLEFDATDGATLVRMMREAYNAKLKEVCTGLAIDAQGPAKEVPDAEAMLHREAPTWSDFGGFTIADGEINTKDTAGYSGKFTWLKPPMNIGKEGFSIWVRSEAKTEKGHRFDTGIGVKGGEFIAESKSPDGVMQASGQIEVKTFSDDGQKSDKTVWIKVMPPKNVVKGQKYYLEIGAFYGPHVTYTFVGK